MQRHATVLPLIEIHDAYPALRRPLGLALALSLCGAAGCEFTTHVADPPWEYAPGVQEGGGETGADDEGFAFAEAGISSGDEGGQTGLEPVDTGSTHGASDDEGGNDDSCLDESFAWDPVRPQIMFVLDASGSMTATMPAQAGLSATRWSVLHDVVRTTLQRHEYEVEFGVKLFPSESAGQGADIDVCRVDPGLEHPLAANAGQAILASIPAKGWSPFGSTPMAAGLDAGFAALAQADATRPRAVILVADGGVSASCGADETPEVVEAAVAEARAGHDISTFVVGVDVDASVAADLANIADAGGAAAGGSQAWFDPHDAAGLDAAIGTIVDGLRSCEVSLSGSPAAELLAPQIAGQALDALTACSPGDWGYVYDPSTAKLTLCGDACEAYLDGEALRVESFCQPG